MHIRQRKLQTYGDLRSPPGRCSGHTKPINTIHGNVRIITDNATFSSLPYCVKAQTSGHVSGSGSAVQLGFVVLGTLLVKVTFRQISH